MTSWKNSNVLKSRRLVEEVLDPVKKSEKVVAENLQHLRKLIYERIKDQGFKADLNDIDTSNITDMSQLFAMAYRSDGGYDILGSIGKPSDGIEGVKNFILETVSEAGPNPCPPIVVGVGIGGTVDKCAQIAKKSLFRDIGQHNENEMIANLEKEMIKKINDLGIGPQGFGGNTTALAVNIETFPTHIAGLPVVVNINCHC